MHRRTGATARRNSRTDPAQRGVFSSRCVLQHRLFNGLGGWCWAEMVTTRRDSLRVCRVVGFWGSDCGIWGVGRACGHCGCHPNRSARHPSSCGGRAGQRPHKTAANANDVGHSIPFWKPDESVEAHSARGSRFQSAPVRLVSWAPQKTAFGKGTAHRRSNRPRSAVPRSPRETAVGATPLLPAPDFTVSGTAFPAEHTRPQRERVAFQRIPRDAKRRSVLRRRVVGAPRPMEVSRCLECCSAKRSQLDGHRVAREDGAGDASLSCTRL